MVEVQWQRLEVVESPATQLLLHLFAFLAGVFFFFFAGWLKGLGAERLSVHWFPNPLILVVLTFCWK